METFLVLLLLVSLIGVATGIVMLIVNYAKDRSKKRSFIVIGSSILATLLIGFSINAYEAHLDKLAAEKEADNVAAFKLEADQFTAKYMTIGSDAEDLGNTEYKAWNSEIESTTYDDYDPSDTITKLELDNASDISSIQTKMDKEKSLLASMKEHKNKTYHYSTYKKAYDDLKDMTDLVSYPSGSYNEFGDNFSTYDQTVADNYNDLTDN